MKWQGETGLRTRTSLLTRLKDCDDQASWQRFFDTYWRLLFSYAVRAGLRETDAQDIVQEVVISVARCMPDFRYDRSTGSFKGWLKRITHRRVADHLRREFRREHLGASPLDAEQALQQGAAEVLPGALESAWNEEWHNNLLELALERVRKRVLPRQYQVFDLLVIRERSAAEVTKVLKLNRAQVYMAKHRMTKLVKEEVRKLELEIESGESPVTARS